MPKISKAMYARKNYLKQLEDSEGNGLVKVITGIRRAGKSVLLSDLFHKHLLDHGVDERQIIDIALDDREYAEFLNPDVFLSYVKSRIRNGERNYILIDEVQMMEDFVSVLLSLLHKPDCDIYVTGSNSRFLSTDIATEFRGRSQEIHVWPLSFSEFMENHQGSEREAWKEYIEFGGLPQLASFKTRQQKTDYLTNLLHTVYVRDLVERNKLPNDKGLTDLIRILASIIGSPCNPLKISKTFDSVIHQKITDDTVSKYLLYLQESFLIHPALRYDVKGRKYIGTETKYYFSDIGLRNSILDFRQIEENHSMENVIYAELRRRGFMVDVGRVETREIDAAGRQVRKKLEVDFVANQGSQRYYIQSAYRMYDEEKIKQEKNSLKLIPDSFKKIIIEEEDIVPYHDNDGFVRMGLLDFLLRPDSLGF